ncbi:MAG: nucleotidyltransferase family protein [Bryobacteraceae bacterium]
MTRPGVQSEPSSGQLLLLRAALGQGAESITAWEEWERDYGLDAPDEGSYRLLPLVHRNLLALGYAGPHANTLKGIHRRAWAGNQALFSQVRPVIEELRAEGIPVLLLKGVALAYRYYPDSGCRPMRDVDILVPSDRARALCRKLEEGGWRALYWRPRALRPSFFQFRHAIDYEHPSGGRVDAHWHALNLCCHPAFDELFWKYAEGMDFLGVPVRTCHATEHLLEVCAHGIVYSPVPPVRWVADALLLLRAERNLDWERLVRTARGFDIAPYVWPALELLRTKFDAPVPAEALRELERAPVSAAVGAEFLRDTAPFEPRTAFQDLLAFYSRWRRSLGGAPPVKRWPGFARYLQYAFELESLWALPWQLARSAFRRAFHDPAAPM